MYKNVKLSNLDEMYPAQDILMQTNQVKQYGSGVYAYDNIPLKVQDNIDLKYEIVAEVNQEKANFDNLNKREASLKNEIQDTISELDKARSEKEELAKAFYDVEKNRNTLSKELEDMKEKKEKSTDRLKEFDAKINSYQSEYRVKEAKHRCLVETE